MEISLAFISFLLWKSKHHSLREILGEKALHKGKIQQVDSGKNLTKAQLGGENPADGFQGLSLNYKKCHFLHQQWSEFGIWQASHGAPNGPGPPGA